MTLLDGIKRQLRSVIEWTAPGDGDLLMQWTENGDEIKNASKLIVGPGQGCIFVYEGQIKSLIDRPCMVDLATDNVPFWTTIKSFMQFFESQHKVGIYFYKTSKILDQKWGTTSAVKYIDPQYRFPVGLKAYGNYSYQIDDAREFFVNVVGSHRNFTVDDFRQVMSARIVQPVSDYLAECRYSYAQIDANREEIARGLSIKLAIAFRKLGFTIADFRIEGTDFDDTTQSRINRIADMTAEAQAAGAVGLDFAKFQQLEAMRDAARNESGGAGLGMGIGAGIGLGQHMAESLAAPASPATTDDPVAKLSQLKTMLDKQLITVDEYAEKKRQILDRL